MFDHGQFLDTVKRKYEIFCLSVKSSGNLITAKWKVGAIRVMIGFLVQVERPEGMKTSHFLCFQA